MGFFAICSAVAAVVLAVQSPSKQELNDLKATGDIVVEELRQHKARHGSYPERVPRAPGGGRFGEWEYECVNACSEFKLRIGYYPFHFFSLSYDSREARWQLDT